MVHHLWLERGLAMDLLRRYVSWSLALAAAIVLIAASARAAQAGTEVLNGLLSLDTSSDIPALREVLLLAAIALATGICAILIAPRSAAGRYKTVGGRIVHDMRQGESSGGTTQSGHDGFAHSVEMNAGTRPDMLTSRSASGSRATPMSNDASEPSPPREEVSPRRR